MQLARMQGVPYNKAIGSVLWPAVVSRLDIIYAVGVLSQLIQNPGQAHWEALKRVISYLSMTKIYGSLLEASLKPLLKGTQMGTGLDKRIGTQYLAMLSCSEMAP